MGIQGISLCERTAWSYLPGGLIDLIRYRPCTYHREIPDWFDARSLGPKVQIGLTLNLCQVDLSWNLCSLNASEVEKHHPPPRRNPRQTLSQCGNLRTILR